jgi:hypothetical protein
VDHLQPHRRQVRFAHENEAAGAAALIKAVYPRVSRWRNIPWGIVFCSFGILLGYLSESGALGRTLPTIKSKYGAVPQTVVE